MKIFAPNSAVGIEYIGPTGVYVTGADGSASVDPSELPQLLKAGWTLGDFAGSSVSGALLKLVSDRVINNVGLAIGTTVTIAFGAFDYMVGAAAATVNTFKHKAAVAALAFGALGTVPASTWALILLQIDASGTVTFKSAAANYTTGYATEALAKAALVAPDAARAAMGYITVLARRLGMGRRHGRTRNGHGRQSRHHDQLLQRGRGLLIVRS